MKAPRRIIGIDPGFALIGYAILELQGNRQSLIESGHITTSAQESFAQRLLIIHQCLAQLLQKHKPGEAALEKLYFGRNSKTALDVAHARGVISLGLSLQGIPVQEYTPNNIKKTITGTAQADKKQIQIMIKRLLNLTDTIHQDDTADAVAIALTHAAHNIKIREHSL